MTIEILEHTADVGLRATGTTIEKAFCEAARGLFSLMIDVDAVKPRAEYAVHLKAASDAELLVDWLSELLAQKELSGLVFSSFEVQIDGDEGQRRLDGIARGEPLDRTAHRPELEVKGISFLGLDVRPTEDGWIARCVFDV